jgi:hypothetical protein
MPQLALTSFVLNDSMHDPRSTLDQLFRETQRYKSSAEYKSLLQFIRRFPAYAPYNCFLLHIQNPGVCYVANARRWREQFHRRPKQGARPLVVLVPFGPVDFVYDAADTEGDPLPKGLLDPFKASGNVPSDVWQLTLDNCPRDLILLAEVDMHSGSAGRVTTKVAAIDKVTVRERRDGKTVETTMKARYTLVLNKTFEPPAKYATLSHELAHLYCGHLGTPDVRWWPNRGELNRDQEEFEAESAAAIVCDRLGIENPSAAYLANYLDANEKVPPVSLETILKAAGLIERMGRELLEPRNYARLVTE